MTFDPGIRIGQIVSNDEICRVFQCSSQSGMRKSNKTYTLVITSDPKKPLYQDEWHGNILHYTGMGKRGDQDINFRENKTLKESNTNGIDVFLFEKLKPNAYLFHGQVKLAGEPYEDKQTDAYGRMRKVWIFPLRLVSQGEPTPIPEDILDEAQEKREKEARKLSDLALKERALATQGISTERSVISRQRTRNPFVAEFVKRRAKGKCELCGCAAPFLDKSGQPYLEEHHIIWLSKGGPDTIENAVALCPNCHRRMHVLDLEEDKELLLCLAATT